MSREITVIFSENKSKHTVTLWIKSSLVILKLLVFTVTCTLQVKLILEQAVKAQRGCRSIAILFLELGR
jgi:hypothetical protein